MRNRRRERGMVCLCVTDWFIKLVLDRSSTSFMNQSVTHRQTIPLSRRRFLMLAGSVVAWGTTIKVARDHDLPESLFPPMAPREYPPYQAEAVGGWHKL